MEWALVVTRVRDGHVHSVRQYETRAAGIDMAIEVGDFPYSVRDHAGQDLEDHGEAVYEGTRYSVLRVS